MAGLRGDDLRRLLEGRPQTENRRPQTERTAPIYNRGRRQLQEPWITLNADWNLEIVEALIQSSPKAQRLLEHPIIREVYFTDEFHSSKSLTFDHLYAAIIQSRADIVNDPSSQRCDDPELAIFLPCASKVGTGNLACAADMWYRRRSSCAYNRRTGMTADPNSTRRTQGTIIANTDILSVERAQHGQATAPVEFNQHGRLQDGETLSRLANRRRVTATMFYADEAGRNQHDRRDRDRRDRDHRDRRD